jgi:hypothetical protein
MVGRLDLRECRHCHQQSELKILFSEIKYGNGKGNPDLNIYI